MAAGGGRIAGGGGLFAGGPFPTGLIAGGPFASGLNAATHHRGRQPFLLKGQTIQLEYSGGLHT